MMNSQELKTKLDALVVKKLVNVRLKENLRLYKYSKRVFFKQLWNEYPELCEARGIVMDQDGNLVSYPFTKVFNHGEQGAGFDRDAEVVAVEKINGFLGVVSLWKNELLITSSGSFESPFVDMAKAYLNVEPVLEMCRASPETTFCFEICDPSDPHIIPEKTGAYLIGARLNRLGSPQYPQWSIDMVYNEYLKDRMGFYRPNWQEFVRYDAITKHCKDPEQCQIEGYVCYLGRDAVKVKSVHYLVKKFFSRSKRDMSEIWTNQDKALQKFDEEFHPVIRALPTLTSSESWTAATDKERLEILNRIL